MRSAKSTYDEFNSHSKENARLLRQEGLLIETAHRLCEALESLGISRSELAKRLGTSRANITQLLGGRRNLTLKSLSDIAYNLGCEVSLDLRPVEYESSMPNVISQWSTAFRESSYYTLKIGSSVKYDDPAMDKPITEIPRNEVSAA